MACTNPAHQHTPHQTICDSAGHFPVRFDSGAPFTFRYGVPYRSEDDNHDTASTTASNYPDSLPDLVTDPENDPAPSEASSTVATRPRLDSFFQPDGTYTRPRLDLYFPGTCDLNHPANVVEKLLGGNRVARSLFQGMMGAAAFEPHPPCPDDLIDVLEYGQHRVRIREAITFTTRRCLDTTSALLHCAAHNHNPMLQGGGAHIPGSIPDEALDELNIPMPALSLLRSEKFGITYELRTYESAEEALAALQLIYDICRHYILVMAYAMLVSFQTGVESKFNFGAVIGMHALDFMPRVRTCFPMGGFAPLVAYMADKQYANKMDFALVRLLNPECEHVLIGSHDGQSYITTWPVPTIQVPLIGAAPVTESSRDVLTRGIRRRQLESVHELLAQLTL
ncbi:hypothetical protein C8R46DRAFT_1326772 [Mycena filopes]|nr:hypothetical protein C8R46DRAFT_1326772 [Mycena filopes]